MPQAEVSQPSSVQSERITEVMFSPGNSTSLPLGQQLYKWLIQHFDEETTEKLVSNLLDDQKLGIWFYDVVDIIGINAEHRKACQQAWIMHEILLTFLLKNTYYFIGSSIEGTFATGEKHDYDVMQYHKSYPVFEKIGGDTIGSDTIILIIRELTTPAG